MDVKQNILGLTVIVMIMAGCSDATIAGKYVIAENKNEYIELNKDGTFTVKQNNLMHSGKYKLTAKKLSLHFHDGNIATGQINGQTLIDPDGIRWTKQ